MSVISCVINQKSGSNLQGTKEFLYRINRSCRVRDPHCIRQSWASMAPKRLLKELYQEQESHVEKKEMFNIEHFYDNFNISMIHSVRDSARINYKLMGFWFIFNLQKNKHLLLHNIFVHGEGQWTFCCYK
jgi:hypothetical protein